MLEDEVIEFACKWLKKDGWKIDKVCKGLERGIDIEASKGDKLFYVEAKGARGNPKHNHSIREKFDAGQLKTHLGVAILKSLNSRLNKPKAQIAIAFPHNEYIEGVIGKYLPDIKKMGIKFLWVNESGNIT